ncbi:MAG TPA: hypothetical protein PKJ26_00795, partial [Candidatus Woesebacteria bacterium]|nr:hypothetical protein [Candidatus Woesebacteria bacterium]
FQRRRTRTISLNQFQLSSIAMMAGAFVVGSYFTLSQVLIPMIRALTETTTAMPADVAFNRGVADILAGYEDGGGLTWALESEVKLATNSGWWDVDYQYKTPVTLKNLSTTTLATASAQITVNTQELVTANKLLNTCADLEVVYASESGEFVRLPRSTIISSGATTCADSPATTVTFPLPSTLQSASSSAGLALYYGNDQATIPNTSEGYNILRSDGSSVSATLVCPFNGTTTCLNQSGAVTPTTATGAIRYSGGSALQTSRGGTSQLNVPVSLVGESEVSIEGWFYFPDWSAIPGTSFVTNPSLLSYGARFQGSLEINPYSGQTTNYIYAKVQGTNGANVAMSGSGWKHLALTYNGTQGKLYVDGNLVSTINPSTTGSLPAPEQSMFRIGNNYCCGSMPLTADEVRISNTVRYTSNFTPQTTPFEPDVNTKLLLHFDENGDDPRNTGKAIDSSGNGNHGTITGAKYVSGLVGVDNSSSSTGAIPASTYASHQGVFIEEGTTNLITNPSFENASSATLNWGTNYFNYATASATFTPSMAKRNSAGPFAAGPMVQGKSDASYAWNNGDSISWSQSNIAGSLTSTIDRSQGSIVFWITPEWNGNDGKTHYIFGQATDFALFKHSDNRLVLYDYGWSYLFDISDWTAGSTYNIVIRWDQKEKIGNSNYNFIITVNDVEKFTRTTSYVVGGGFYRLDPMDSIIEGLTIYRRPLFDGTYGTDVGNADEIAQIYNSGTGKDPTLVTGSWDVVFALPTNASTGALTTGTGNAWSHPHSSNLLYTSTTNTGGFMMAGDAGVDGWLASPQQISGLKLWLDAGSIMGLSDGDQVSSMTDLSGSGFHATQTISANKPIYKTNQIDGKPVIRFDGTNDYLSVGTIRATEGGVTSLVVSKRDSIGGTQWQRIVGSATHGDDSIAPGWVITGASDGAGNPLVYTPSILRASHNSGRVISNLKIGVDSSLYGRYFVGDVAEILVYDRELNSVEESAVRSYLTSKYDLTNFEVTALSSSEKIFSGGYKFTSNATNQGIYRSFTATNGGDYVLRALGHSDGTCNPQVKITRADGSTEISHLNGTTTSTRTDPDVYIFTWESPAAEANQVQLINTASSGTCYWHQVEVFPNLITNPSLETGIGSAPYVPTGWVTNGSSGGSVESMDCHSGSACLNGSIEHNRFYGLNDISPALTTGKFFSWGHWSKMLNGSNIRLLEGTHIQQHSNSAYQEYSISYPSWTASQTVQRVITSNPELYWFNQGGSTTSFLLDDAYAFALSDVSLTVTPANQANSTEASGLRVDGADTLTQPITGLSADRGVIKFKFTPRHSIAVADKFGASFPVIVAIGSGNDRIELYKGGGNSVGLQGYFNAAAVTASWNSPTFVAGSTYNIEIRYRTGG